jgi:hypothetical protein
MMMKKLYLLVALGLSINAQVITGGDTGDVNTSDGWDAGDCLDAE